MRDTYQSTLSSAKALSQLKMFQIDDLKLWAFRFITILVLIAIVYVSIKIFQYINPVEPKLSKISVSSPV
jgi:hypothetical protein